MSDSKINAANVRAELTAVNPNSKEAIRKAIADAIANGAKITKGKTPDVNSKRSFTFKGVECWIRLILTVLRIKHYLN